jgi:Fur family ferric uptake transcriptional regulator
MCNRCDYRGLLQEKGVSSTPHRLHVLEIIGSNPSPLSAEEIFATLNRDRDVNRVTIYRILDVLVEKQLVEPISSGDRAVHYGLAPNRNHPRHAHFYCTQCGRIECLRPGSLDLRMEPLERTFSGLIKRAEVRLDGVCKDCLKPHQNP